VDRKRQQRGGGVKGKVCKTRRGRPARKQGREGRQLEEKLKIRQRLQLGEKKKT